MPDRPIIIFPAATTIERTKRPSFSPGFNKPSALQQRQRLQRRFDRIANSLRNLQSQIEGLDPELVIVLEAFGSITDVARRAANIPGLEWLTELDLIDAEPSDGFQYDQDSSKPYFSSLISMYDVHLGGQQLPSATVLIRFPIAFP